MKRWIIWSFDRGSFQYDVLCGLILIVIFLIPPAVFNDRPDHLRIPRAGEFRRVLDDGGNAVYTVGLGGTSVSEQGARETLQSLLQRPEPVGVTRVEPVYDTRGHLAAYSFWLRDDDDESH